MPRYLLHLHLPGQHIAPLDVDADSPADLAAAIHAHARPRLGSRTVDVHLDHAALAGEIHRAGSPAGTFTLDQVAEEQPAAANVADGIRWGWTLHDLQRLARSATLSARFLHSAAWQDYYDEALSAIYMHLAAADTKPDRGDLLRAADTAIVELVRGQRRDRGYREGDDQYRIKWHPQFFRYWFTDPGLDLAERVAERVAVHQIIAALWPDERAAVEALAACGHYDTAAESLGITEACFRQRLHCARRRFLRLWYYPEAAGLRWQQDRRRATNPRRDVCSSGHEYTPENSGFRSSGSRRGERYCKACSRARRVRSTARRAGQVAA